MTNELLNERRSFQKKRFISSLVQLSFVLFMTVYDCIAELFFPNFVLPISFYLPQFIITYSQATLGKGPLFILFVVLAFAITVFIGVCLSLSKRHYGMVAFITAIIYVDFILLIYIGIQSILLKGFQPFFIVNIFLHIWLIVLTIRLRRSSEALEVLPDHTIEEDDGISDIRL